jgi:uncharacterized membrane protein YagU involved in acid resistance
MARVRKEDVRATLLAGAAGAIAIAAYLLASLELLFHTPPRALFAWDTSNLLGLPAALHAGLPGIVLGQAAHLVVSLAWAGAFVVLARRVSAMTCHPLVAGLLFGVVVMLVMRYAIVPLGRAPLLQLKVPSLVNSLVAHTVFFGVPVALVVRKILPRRA